MSDLTTLAAVKAYIGLTDFGDDAVISSLITAYSEWIRSFTNRDFTIASYEIWRSGRGQVALMTPQSPITAVTLVEVGGRAIGAAVTFGSYGYRFTDMAIILSGGAVWCIGAQNCHVVYSAGYATVPADIAQACNELVALRYKMRDKLEWSSKSLAGETVSLVTKDMPDSVRTVLRQYQNVIPT